ncbi:F-box protein [Legionella fairfieldensis]|uniref:F-box protein n=1 Tax=Legionella fairfieldensis TaxID=45064 RepID=UPI0010411CCC|nr:F-box protein [Legionella fairfieldensis]
MIQFLKSIRNKNRHKSAQIPYEALEPPLIGSSQKPEEPWRNIPEEIWISDSLFGRLSPVDLFNLLMISKQFNIWASKEKLWQNFFNKPTSNAKAKFSLNFFDIKPEYKPFSKKNMIYTLLSEVYDLDCQCKKDTPPLDSCLFNSLKKIYLKNLNIQDISIIKIELIKYIPFNHIPILQELKNFLTILLEKGDNYKGTIYSQMCLLFSKHGSKVAFVQDHNYFKKINQNLNKGVNYVTAFTIFLEMLLDNKKLATDTTVSLYFDDIESFFQQKTMPINTETLKYQIEEIKARHLMLEKQRGEYESSSKKSVIYNLLSEVYELDCRFIVYSAKLDSCFFNSLKKIYLKNLNIQDISIIKIELIKYIPFNHIPILQELKNFLTTLLEKAYGSKGRIYDQMCQLFSKYGSKIAFVQDHNYFKKINQNLNKDINYVKAINVFLEVLSGNEKLATDTTLLLYFDDIESFFQQKTMPINTETLKYQIEEIKAQHLMLEKQHGLTK